MHLNRYSKLDRPLIGAILQSELSFIQALPIQWSEVLIHSAGMLCEIADPRDFLLVWKAKHASFDCSMSIPEKSLLRFDAGKTKAILINHPHDPAFIDERTFLNTLIFIQK